MKRILKVVLGLVVLIALALGSLWGVKTFCTRTVHIDVPVAAADHTPGALQKVEQIGTYPAFMLRFLVWWAKLPGEIPVHNGARLYRVQYWTAKPNGDATVASGLVCMPKTAAPRAAISYHHGTATNRRLSPSAPTLIEGGLGAAVFAGGGYVVCAPDYIGLGVNRDVHLYLHAQGTANAAVDLLKATHALTGHLKKQWPSSLCLLGFSQGGYSTMAVHRALEALNDPRFRVVACAPIAGIYDLAGITFPRFLEGKGPYYSAYLAYLAYAYCSAYGHPLDSLLADPYARDVPALFDGEHDEWVVAHQMPDTPRKLFRKEFLDAYDAKQPSWFMTALAENEVFKWTPRAPVRFYYSEGDGLVAPEESKEAAKELVKRGCDARAVDVGNYVHGMVVVPAVPKIRAWFDEATRKAAATAARAAAAPCWQAA